MHFHDPRRPIWCYRPSFITPNFKSAESVADFPRILTDFDSLTGNWNKDILRLVFDLPYAGLFLEPERFNTYQVNWYIEVENFKNFWDSYLSDPELWIREHFGYEFRPRTEDVKRKPENLKGITLADL